MARILVIDDDNQLRSLLRLALEMAGHQVVEAVDGEQGLKAYQEHLPDLVLCDLIMDNKEGLETIRELRRRFAEEKIIAMSGGLRGGKVNFLALAKTFGAAKVLTKPFDIKTLSAAIDEILNDPVSLSKDSSQNGEGVRSDRPT
jgi:DNA-binding response OmpR family regulator